MLHSSYICDAIRTPFDRQGGALSVIRADELAALPLSALMVRHAYLDWEQVDDVFFGCADQAGEADGNVARNAALLAGLPDGVAALTLNRMAGSGMDAIGQAARAIRCGEASLVIAGGVESSSRASSRTTKSGDEQFTNKALITRHGSGSLLASASRLAEEGGIEAFAQAQLATASLKKAHLARDSGWFDSEITPVTLAGHGQNDPQIVTRDGLPAMMGAPVRRTAEPGDGACGLLLASGKAAHKFSLLPRARVLGMTATGVSPAVAGLGAAAASRKLLVQLGIAMESIDVIELHESSAAAVIAVLRDWGLQDDDARLNPAGGALALGDPSGASGARMVMAAINTLHRIKARHALCAMSIGCGQGIALLIERV